MTTTLITLWESSLALSGLALLAVLALLLARALSGRRSTRRAAMRRHLVPLMLAGDTSGGDSSRLSRQTAAELALELAELVRGTDREAMIASAAALGADRVLRRKLRSRLAQDRLLAAEALAMFPDEADTVARLIGTDRNPDVRLGAALALAEERRAPPAAELARSIGIGTRENSLLVTSLLRDLVERDADGVEALLYDRGVSDSAKLAATDALADSGVSQHAPLVAWMAMAAARQDGHLQPRIYRALGRIGHPSGHAAIAAGLDSPLWQVRAAAAQAAGQSGMTQAVPQLVALLDDGEWWIRFRAAEALIRLGAAGVEALRAVASDGGQRASIAASTMLAEHNLA